MTRVRVLGVVISLVVAAAFVGCGSGGGTGPSGAAGAGGAAGAAGAAGTSGAAGAAGGPVVCATGVTFTPNTSATCADCINQNCCPESVSCGADPTDLCGYCVSGIDAACSTDTPFENLEACISAHCTGCGVFY